MRVLTVALAVVFITGVVHADILFDFGEFVSGCDPLEEWGYVTRSPDPYQSRHWNNIWGMDWDPPDPNEVFAFNNLIDTAGVGTGVNLAVSGFTVDGYRGIPGDGLYPETAQIDAIGVRCADANNPIGRGIVTVSGLTEPLYTIKLFSSTHEDVEWYNDDTRRTQFTIGTDTRIVHCSGNTSYIETYWDIAAVDGTITVQVTGATPGGEETYSYGYLNVMEIVVPEPATLGLLALGAAAMIRRQ